MRTERILSTRDDRCSPPPPSDAGAGLARVLAAALFESCVTVAPGVVLGPRHLEVGLAPGEFESLERPTMLEIQFGRFLTWLAIQRGYLLDDSIEVRLHPDPRSDPQCPRISAALDPRRHVQPTRR